jgi:hypothetical protein
MKMVITKVKIGKLFLCLINQSPICEDAGGVEAYSTMPDLSSRWR